MHRRKEDPWGSLTSHHLFIKYCGYSPSQPLHAARSKNPQTAAFCPLLLPLLLPFWWFAGRGAFNQRCTCWCCWEAVIPVCCGWIRAPRRVNHRSIWHVRVVENDSLEFWSLENIYFFPLLVKFGIVAGFVWVPSILSRESGVHWRREKWREARWRGGKNRALETQLVGWELLLHACPSLSLVTYMWAAARCQEGRSSWTKRMWLLCSVLHLR